MRRLAAHALVALSLLGCQRPTAKLRSAAPVQRPEKEEEPWPDETEEPLPEAAPASQTAASSTGGRIFGALRNLERGGQSAVRITWLGDSHTAADFWTGEIRRKLQARFGEAGPGFVPFALGSRRHEVASFKIQGTWRQEPKSGPSRHRQLDGQFGLAGRRVHGYPGASIDVNGGVRGRARWSLLYRSEPSQSPAPHFEVSDINGAITISDAAFQGFNVASFEHDGAMGPVSLDIRRGQFSFFGVVVESAQPGLVLDALGINGARLRTLQAWDAAAWSGQLAWRKPDLVVLAYGTNETGDGGDMGRYADDYREVVAEVRQTGADCLLVGPTDRQDKKGHTMVEVEQLDANQRDWAQTLGCLYYSAFSAMGGRGGYDVWRNRKPQLAGTDGVHLTMAGYRFLADHWVRAFLADYESYQKE